MKNKQGLRILLELVAGMVFSVILCYILIFLGYSTFYKDNFNEYTVNIFGLPIYEIVMQSGKGPGTAFNQNMFLVNIICSIITVIAVETTIFIKNKNKPEITEK